MPTELTFISAEESERIDALPRADTPAIWSGYREQLEKLKLTAETLSVTDISQKAEMKLARSTRLTLRELRIEIEHKRKELGEEALKRTQKINAAAKELKEAIEPLEQRLLEQEEFAERKAEEELTARIKMRQEALQPFWNPVLPMPHLGALTDDQFVQVLADTKADHEAKIAAAKKAEEDRIAQAKAEAEAREAQRLENERLKAEAVEREKAAAEERRKHVAEHIAAEIKARTERDAAELKARKEREAIEAKAKKEREAAEAKAREEQQKRQAAEAELAKKRQAEETAARLKQEQEEAAAAAPDKAKLKKLAESIRALELPVLTSAKGPALITAIKDQKDKLAAWIEAQAPKLIR